MEATGCYGMDLATYLQSKNYKVSIVNPARVKGFAKSELARVKTDKADAKLIAKFCMLMHPDIWKVIPKHLKQLQDFVKRINAL